MVLEHVTRRVGRGEDFDVEALEQRARPELRRLQPLTDGIVHAGGRVGAQALAHSEDFMQLVIEPRTGRRAAKQVIVLGEHLPHVARVAVQQCVELHSIGVQQSQDVMVGLDDQRRGLREGRVLGENARIHVAVG